MTYTVDQIPDLNGKVALVTGGTSGIGFCTALEMARKNCIVIFTARSAARGQNTLDLMKAQLPANSNISYGVMINDSLQSVTEFAEWFKSKYSSLDILVNNAGIFCPDFKLLDGIESQMMVNHLSHFHLTLKLLPLFTESSRIVNVSSEAGEFIKSFHVDFDSMNDPKLYSKFEAYKISKLANILFSKALLKRISPEKKFLVHSLHPGRVATGIASKVGAPAWLKSCCVPIVHLFMMAKEDGALTTLYVATHPEVQRAPNGSYWHPIAKRRDLSGKPADDEALAERLWAWSEAQVARITGRPSES